jgi:hypothetical protein
MISQDHIMSFGLWDGSEIKVPVTGLDMGKKLHGGFYQASGKM